MRGTIVVTVVSCIGYIAIIKPVVSLLLSCGLCCCRHICYYTGCWVLYTWFGGYD